jgi:hypothetical protein
MFALWPGERLNFSNFKLQRFVSRDNARLRKPATSHTQPLAARVKDDATTTNRRLTTEKKVNHFDR